MNSWGGDGSARAKEDGVGVDAVFALVLLDIVDTLDESVETPATRLDPVQVAGTCGTEFSPAIRATHAPGAHLEFTFGMDRHSTKFTRLSQFAQAPDRSLG